MLLSVAQRDSLMSRRQAIGRELAHLSMTDSSLRTLTGADVYFAELIDERDEIERRLRYDADLGRKIIGPPHATGKSRRLLHV